MNIQPGSIIHGTQREEDLIPAFIDALCGGPEDRLGDQQLRAQLYEELAMGQLNKSEAERQQFVSEFLYDYLWGKLNGICPPGLYFGTLEGDGSDYGFWEHPEENADECDIARQQQET